MKIPYNVLHVSGNILFAARGGKIHSFGLDEGTHLSTWKHPDVDKVDSAVRAIASAVQNDNLARADSEAVEGGDNDEPPAKRQRVDTGDDESKPTEQGDEAAPKPGSPENEASAKQTGQVKGKGKKSKNKKNDKPRPTENQFSRVPDRPVITHLTSTTDGGHLVGVTGHDKVVWVFENDGKGRLTELSRRTMPKRPSSIAIGTDSQIICADKFGDVYSLPLLVVPSSTSRASSATPAPANAKAAYKPAANNLTVHSKRNLRALTNQQLHMELASRSKSETATKPEGPDFDLSLLLGHVSMLTTLTLAESEGRWYILTADRDEHIRVSRYIPQAYVIEGFCFGHKEFVSALLTPESNKDVLISGGGDEDIFVWDWKASKQLSKTSILSLAQEIAPDTTKVAVSGLYSLVYPSDSGGQTYIIALCEGVQAIFTWLLTKESTLTHPGIIQVPGSPLDIAIKPIANAAPKLLVATDPGETGQAKSLSVFTLATEESSLVTESIVHVDDGAVEAEELEITGAEVRKLLYNVESLRKQSAEQGEEDGGEDVVGEGASAAE